MPEIGGIRKGREIGKKGSHQYVWQTCVDCGKEHWVILLRGKPQSQRCKSCTGRRNGKLAHTGKRGVDVSNWKGGRTVDGKGYVYILLYPDDFFYPMANKGDYVYEHRLVVAKALGRCLHPWELVHHKHTKYPGGRMRIPTIPN